MADTSNTSANAEPSGDTGAGDGAAGAGASTTASFSDFSSKNVVSGSTDFLESNSWVAKLAFLLMVILGFVILFRLMISFITWIFSPSGKVVLVNGLQNGSVSSTISQDPNNKSSITILRSENEKDGIEFIMYVFSKMIELPEYTSLGDKNTTINENGKLYFESIDIETDS